MNSDGFDGTEFSDDVAASALIWRFSDNSKLITDRERAFNTVGDGVGRRLFNK
jgi:hypothetical protein